MFCGFSHHGDGSAEAAITYLTSLSWQVGDKVKESLLDLLFRSGLGACALLKIPIDVGARAVAYLAGDTHRRMVRIPPPAVLRGDPDAILRAVRLAPGKNKFTVGCLSWEPGELVTVEAELAAMDEFERVAFPGLKRGKDYLILWVRHTHAMHHELNFMIPRVHLPTWTTLNIAPRPTSKVIFDTFRMIFNYEHGFSDPDDPGRQQMVRLPHWLAKKAAYAKREGTALPEDVRIAAHARMDRRFRDGLLHDTADVVAALRSDGWEIAAQHPKCIVVSDGEKTYTLEGRLYWKDFSSKTLRMLPYTAEEKAERLNVARARMAEMIASRRRYNERYLRGEANGCDVRDRSLVATGNPALGGPVQEPGSRSRRAAEGLASFFEAAVDQMARARKIARVALERSKAAGQAIDAAAKEYARLARAHGRPHSRRTDSQEEAISAEGRARSQSAQEPQSQAVKATNPNPPEPSPVEELPTSADKEQPPSRLRHPALVDLVPRPRPRRR